jgi:8-oxo-dGTP pyrophosphatase MutT (NUDIX family)
MPRAVAARPSASVILVRDGESGLETFMVRRHARSRVAPSAYVFPGGTVRDDDRRFAAADGEELGSTLSGRADEAVPAAAAVALYVSAVRELFEEAGVLLVRDSAAELLAVADADQPLQERLASTRLALQASQLALADVLSAHAWQAAFDRLVPFSHWVTPEVLAARFDTRFFIAEMPPGQAALHCTIETSEGLWISPSAVLRGEYNVVYATAQHLRRIAPCATVAELLEFARTKPIRRIQPEVVERGAGLSVWLPPELVDNW